MILMVVVVVVSFPSLWDGIAQREGPPGSLCLLLRHYYYYYYYDYSDLGSRCRPW